MKRWTLLVAAAAVFAAGAARADSCWPQTGASLFADNKARRVGDVVTVIIVEQSSVSSESGTTLSKTEELEAKVDALELAAARLLPKGATLPNVKGGTSRTFDGKGSSATKASMSTNLTAVVTEVLPNGNLVIDGSRLRTSDDDKNVVRVSGIIRPQDISSANTVLSTAVAQGKIVFESSGPTAQSSRRGFLGRIVDRIWPF